MMTVARILEIVSFLDLLAAGLIVPQLPPQARSLGGNHILIGLMGALYSGFQLVSSPLTGSLSDLKGRQTVLLLSLCISGLAYTLLGVTTSIVLFLGLRAILGVTKHTQLLTKALAPDYVKDKNQLSEVYGRINTLRQVGMAVGPIISGHIVATFPEFGFTIIAFTVGAIFAVNSNLISKLPKLQPDKKKEKEKKEADITTTLVTTLRSNFNESLDEFYKIDWKIYGDIFLFKLLMSLCFGIYITNYVLFLKIKHGLSSIGIGYIISLYSIIGSLTSLFIGNINKYYANDKDYSIRNLHVFMILTISLIGVMVAPTVSIYVIFIMPLAISFTVGSLVTQEVILSKTSDEQRGAVLGVSDSIRSLSGVVAPLVTGIVSYFVGVLHVVNIPVILSVVGAYKSYVFIQNKTSEAKKK